MTVRLRTRQKSPTKTGVQLSDWQVVKIEEGACVIGFAVTNHGDAPVTIDSISLALEIGRVSAGRADQTVATVTDAVLDPQERAEGDVTFASVTPVQLRGWMGLNTKIFIRGDVTVHIDGGPAQQFPVSVVYELPGGQWSDA